MNGSIACVTQEKLQRLADDDLSPQESSELEGHVTECAHCRAIMDQIAGDADWGQELRRALSCDKDAERPNDLGDEDVAPDGAGSFQHLLKLLGPTDDPRMLGRIGPYEITGILGKGGMGVVFKGYDGALNRYVAIKMLLPHLAASGAAQKRFAREAQASAAVVNDHVMAIHAVAEWQGMPYLVMPYGRGISLQKRLDDEGALGVAEILRIGMQAAVGLAAAHAQGLVHRDVKPANILLADGVERVTLTDFGLARAVDDVSLTRVGVLAGTPPYMSPEQARGQSVDGRSDLFSLGSVLYAMCTGRAPFRADSSYGVLRLVSDTDPSPIREINPEIPDWLCGIVNKLMAKRPEHRFETAEDVAELLQSCLAHVQQPTAAPLPLCLRQPSNHAGSVERCLAWLAIAVALILLPTSLWLGGAISLVDMQEDNKGEPVADAKKADVKGKAPVPKKDLPPTPEQLRAIAILKRLDVKFQFDAPGRPVVHVSFQPGTAVDDILEDLLPLTEIGVLGLQGTKITDAGLKHVAGFKKMHQLYLGQTAITDAGLKELATHERLEHLGLENTRISDAGIHAIARLKNLKYLNIGSTDITDACLKDIGGFHQMGMLCLYSTQVTDAGMKELRGLTNLRTLLVNDTALTDAGLKELAPLKQLKKINAQNTTITETGLKTLKKTAPAVKVEEEPGAAAGEPPTRARGWLAAVGVIAGVLTLVGATVVLLVRKRPHSDKATPTPERLPKKAAPSAPAPLPISLQCSKCQRELKAKAEHAGKAVKCPGCGSAVEVPSLEAGLPRAKPARPNG